MIKMIACIGKNRELGKNNGLIFNLKKDMQFFKTMTSGTHKMLVCGENTLKSFPNSKPLPGRITVVLSPEGHDYLSKDCLTFHNFNKMLNFLDSVSKDFDIWVIGGGMMYKSMLPYCSDLYLTEVDAEDKEATVFFPEYKKYFELESSQEDSENGYNFRFCHYIKPIEDPGMEM